MNGAFPIVRIELQGMKHVVQAALRQHLIKMDTDIQAAIDQACTPEKITWIIQQTAEAEIKAAIESHIRDFYRYGDGRAAIRDAVESRLKRRESK